MGYASSSIFSMILASLLFTSGAFASPESADPDYSGEIFLRHNPDWIMNGMNMLPLGKVPFGGQQACEEVRNLKSKLKINTILMRKYLRLKDFDSDEITEPKNDGATDQEILRQFRMDKKLGVKSFFDMGITLDSDHESKEDQQSCNDDWHPWHGTIDYGTPEKYDNFFWNYGQKLLHYADLARQGGNVSIFSIGHELASLSATKKLESPLEIKTYVNNLAWFLNPSKMDKKANDWAKTTVTDLVSFSDGLQKRQAGRMPVGQIKADNRTSLQRGMDNLSGYFHNKKEEIKSSIFHKEPVDYRKELLDWANGGAKRDLSKGATDYLIQLENTRRAYLEGMWEQLIAKVRMKFAGMKNPPLLTYDDNGFMGQTGFLDKLDIIAGSQYGTIGSYDNDWRSPHYGMGIDDGKTSVKDLKEGWMRALSQASDEAKHLNKKVLFSELGFSRRAHSTIDPWRSFGCQQLLRPDGSLEAPVRVLERPISKTERVHAIEALRELVGEGKLPWLAGVAMWGTYTDPRHLPNEFCVDCKLPDSEPYKGSIRALFETVGAVTNQASPADPCLPPAPKVKPIVVAKEKKEKIEAPSVPFLDVSNTASPENPLGLPIFDYRPAKPVLEHPQGEPSQAPDAETQDEIEDSQ